MRRLRFTIANFGSTGDALPALALAVGLRDAGHEAVVAGDVCGAAPAAAADIEFHPLTTNEVTKLGPGSPGFETFERGRFTASFLRDLGLPDRAWLEELGQAAAGSDLVVAGPIAGYHALSAAQSLGIPSVLASFQPLVPSRDHVSALGSPDRSPLYNLAAGRLVNALGWAASRKALNRARRSLGQRRIGNPNRGVRTLGAWSPTLSPQPRDWNPDRHLVVGQWYRPSLGFEPDADLAAFLADGEPPVYVGFGSMPAVSWLPRLRRTVLEALRGRRVLLSAGWAGLDADDLPNDVFPLGFVPHEWLFPRCAAVVHHCGAGTTHAAARAGVPSIPVPFAMDQPFWGVRLHRLGISARPLDPRTLTADGVRQALAEIEIPEVAAACARAAEQIAYEDGVARTVPLLEQACRAR